MKTLLFLILLTTAQAGPMEPIGKIHDGIDPKGAGIFIIVTMNYLWLVCMLIGEKTE